MQRALLVAVGLAMSTASLAQGHPCASVVDASERLRCYDRAFPPAREVQVLKSAAEKEVDARRDFGLSAAQRELRESGLPEVERVEGRILNVERIETGQRIVKLESGEVWLLTESTRSGPLDTGDVVQIRKGMLPGTFTLVTPRKVNLRARRIR